jgi:hypothetical protein
MNILVIGNGFDLAHELPTRYKDFLEWIKAEYALYFEDCRNRSVASDAVKVDWPIKISPSKITVKAINNVNIQTEIWECINNNFWIDYFLNNSRYINENWIDFESEVSKVIQSLDGDMHGLNENEIYNLDDKIISLSNDYLREKYSECTLVVQQINMLSGKGSPKSITFKEIRNRLLNDLNKLIRVLEIYLATYVNEAKHSEELSVIKDIFEKKDEQGNVTAFIDTKILSFNYTETFKRIYKHNFDIDYIHGKADINNTIDTNNMVLGIDEYLPKKRKDKDIKFIAFKKFYQRIYKGTGCKYKEWIDTIKGDFADYQTELEKSKTEKNTMNQKVIVNKLKKQYLNKHHVYIFGHSLDVTDKDILSDLILNDNVQTTIFYHDKDAMGQQIANLVKVIGQDELIRRTGGITKTIEFKLQQDMVPIVN